MRHGSEEKLRPRTSNWLRIWRRKVSSEHEPFHSIGQPNAAYHDSGTTNRPNEPVKFPPYAVSQQTIATLFEASFPWRLAREVDAKRPFSGLRFLFGVRKLRFAVCYVLALSAFVVTIRNELGSPSSGFGAGDCGTGPRCRASVLGSARYIPS